MKHFLHLLAISILLQVCLTTHAQVSIYDTGKLFVKTKDQPGQEARLQQFTSENESRFSINSMESAFRLPDKQLQNIYILTLDNEEYTDDLMELLEGFSWIEYAEHVPLYQTFYTPNDLQQSQWGLTKVQADLAWDLSQGSSDVVVAMVDDAVLLSHEDLTDIIWINPGETPGNNIDDDNNGYVDDINGYDVADGDNDPNPPVVNQAAHTHGTHCAGIVTASTDNSTGIASIGFGLKIMAVKSQSDQTAPPYLTNPYAGVEYAIAAGADVISMSWGGGAYSNTYQQLFDYANSLGIVLVAAAGNSNTDIIHYPSGYNHVIAVGATDINDEKASFSNYGSWVDVMAPGKDIYSTLSDNNSAYGNLSGTSMACPLVSGLCGLMLSYAPGMSPEDVEDCLKNTCDNIDAENPGHIGLIGAGRINAYEAVACLSSEPVARFSADYTQICPGQTIQFFDQSVGIPATSWQWTFIGGNPATSNLQNPTVAYSTAGLYDVTLIATNVHGSDTITQTTFVNVTPPNADISGSTSILEGSSTNLIVNFNGNPPWSFTYSDGANPISVFNVTSNPYFLPVSPDTSTTYNLTFFEDSFCTGTYSGQATVNVLPLTPSLNCNYSNIYGDANPNSFSHVYYDPAHRATYVTGKLSNSRYISKIDLVGNIVWTRDYNLIGENDPTSIVGATNNQDLLVSYADNDAFLVMRLDSVGNLKWAKKYTVSGRQRISLLVPSLNDTYIMTGWIPGDDVAITRIDGNGNIIWAKKIHAVDDQVVSITTNGAGGCVVTGPYISAGSYLRTFIAEMDVNGNPVHLKKISTNNANNGRGITRTSNGYMLVSSTGPTHNDHDKAVIMNLDNNLDVRWQTVLTGLEDEQVVNPIAEDIHGDFYVPFKPKIGGVTKVAVAKYTANGDFLWAKSMDHLVSSVWSVLSVVPIGVQPVDNIYLFGTSTTIPGGFGQSDGVLIRSDTSLNSCLAVPYIPGLSAMNFATSNWAATVSNVNYTVTNETVSLGSPVLGKTEFCATVCEDSCYSLASMNISDTAICLGDTVFLSADSVTGSFLEWQLNGLTYAHVQDTFIVISQPGLHDITLLGSDNLCSSVDSATVRVFDVPEVEAGPDTSVCAGSTVQLFASGGNSYTWLPNNWLNNNTINNPVANPAASIDYVVSVSDSNSCIAHDTVSINTSICCGSAASYRLSDSVICVGDTVDIQNNSITNGAVTYSWFLGAGASPSNSALTNPTVYYSTGGSKTITLVMDDDCGTEVLTKTVAVYEPPLFEAGDDTSVCLQDTLEYQLGDVPVSNWIYEWTPIVGISDPDIANPDVMVTNPITYYLSTIDPVSGCESVDSVVIDIGVTTSVSLSGLDSAYCENDPPVPMTGNPAGGYYWGPGVVGGNLFNPKVPGVGVHEVAYTIPGSCIDTAFFNVEIIPEEDCVTGIGLATNGLSINVFPNPFNEEIIVQINGPVNDRIELEMRDVLGRMILKRDFTELQAATQLQIKLPETFSEGIYFMQLEVGEHSQVFKLIKRER